MIRRWFIHSFLPFVTLAIILSSCTSAFSQSDPKALVSTMVNNELGAQKNPHYWMYIDNNTQHGKKEVSRVLQTRECWFRWPLSINGHAASSDSRSKAAHDIQQLVSDPSAREKNRKDIDEDSSKANSLLKILPDAFLFTNAGERNGNVVLKFRPNPNYDPPSNEAKVFHAMAGQVIINKKETQLVGISGKLIHDVDFGWGILGKIRKGGTFSVLQSQVAPDDWEVTQLDVHINGRALFFHAIREQQHEVMTNFTPVPADISLKQAAEMVKRPGPKPPRARDTDTPK